MSSALNSRLSVALPLSVLWLAVVCQLAAQTVPPDADLYYRRTHDGAWPAPGVNPGDHSGETTDATEATSALQPMGTVRPAALLDNGVDPYNLGQGDWIWTMSACESALGVSTPQAVIDYEVSKGMQWVCVKAGDGHSSWSQWNSTLINEAHAKGLKIFAWVYVYGNNSGHYGTTSSANVSGEINLALNALAIGGDGLIIDAEIEYQTNATRLTDAIQYASALKSSYPSRFLAYAPFPYISYHTPFPYVQFGTYCDAVMPQTYWADFGISVVSMVHDLDGEWSAWQNSLAGAATNAIKPIIPIGQGWNLGSYVESAADITNFVYLLKNDPAPAGRGGYHGVSYWSCQHHTAADWTGMATSLILNGTPNVTAPRDAGATFAVNLPAGGAYHYQWKFNGASIPGATNSSYTIAGAQTANAGAYSVRASNATGCARDYAGLLSVMAPLVNAPGSILAPPNLVSWWPGDGNGDEIYGPTADAQQNETTYAAGETGRAFHFDGASSFVKTGASSLPPPWTVCFWVNRQNAPGSSAALLSDTGANVLKLEQFNGTRAVGVTVQGVADYTFPGGYIAPANTWTHLAFLDNGSQVQLYANGVFQGALALNFPLPRDYIGLDSFTVTDAIGAKTSRKFTDYLLGSLDEILVFNRALGASEISAIYQAASAGLVRAPEFTGVTSAGGQLLLSLRGQTGKSFSLYSSPDLVNWTLQRSFANPTGALNLTNGLDAGTPQNFYRVSQP